uniref:Integral membrane protein TerC n=1 Tax=Guillardia theta TaxID=55529 RepID=A0A7S4NWD4_GUITH|mmetsp:Transcript_36823/g.115215  ORF Transcript_36823/g.115215 Transcript_36823/m.115215 type:complete len:380 (+) Transcript_36823:205-1344(+)
MIRIVFLAMTIASSSAFMPSMLVGGRGVRTATALPVLAPRPLALQPQATRFKRSNMGLRMQLKPNEPESQEAAVQELETDPQTFSKAVKDTLLYIGAAAAFGGGIWAFLGQQAGVEFFSGYLLEESLSVDNLFVFILLFQYFKTPVELQRRVLTWGIAGAIVMRGFFISAGLVAIRQYRGILVAFAGFLIYSSYKILAGGGDDDDDEDLSNNSVVKFSSKLLQSTKEYDGGNFFTQVDGVKRATPLLLVLFCVEFSDILFAVDSIPAVFGVTEDPFVVFTSNIFAILGLRSLYLVISKLVQELEYLEPAVGLVLGFVGLKMIGEFMGMDTPEEISLGVVVSMLSAGVAASYWKNSQKDGDEEDQVEEKQPVASQDKELP